MLFAFDNGSQKLRRRKRARVCFKKDIRAIRMLPCEYDEVASGSLLGACGNKSGRRVFFRSAVEAVILASVVFRDTAALVAGRLFRHGHAVSLEGVFPGSGGDCR